MNRIVKVARMQLLNRNTFIGIPLIILGGSFLLSLLIFALIPYDGYKFAGGAPFAPMWYYVGAGVYGLTLTFPFSQAMSVTRREFILGTLLTAALSALALSLLFVAMGFVEGATGGWWMNGYFFQIPGAWEIGPLFSALVYFVIVMLLFISGFIFATVYRRWGVTTLVSILIGLALILVAAVFFISRFTTWEVAFSTLGDVPPLGWVGIGGILTLALSFLAARLLRRSVV